MLLQELRHSFRRLVRAPGFTLTAILTLALGIGANTSIFSTVSALLLRPYPFPKLARLMLLREADSNQPGQDTAAAADYLDFRAQVRAFSDIAAFRFGDFNLGTNSGTGSIEGYNVTTNLFQLIGTQPLLGRNLMPDDDQQRRNLVVVISHNPVAKGIAHKPWVPKNPRSFCRGVPKSSTSLNRICLKEFRSKEWPRLLKRGALL